MILSSENASDDSTGANSLRPGIARPRIALVGCGQVGELHRARLEIESVDVVAICDPDAQALSRMASRISPRPRLFRSEQDLLTAGIVDGVILCTPHGLHAAQIEASLSAGVHVLCEKPFVTEAADAIRLVEQARTANLALFVAYTRRSRGHARFLAHALTEIGPLTHINILRAQPWRDRHLRTWRMHSGAGGGFLLDNGVSMLDLVLRLTEDAPIIHAEADLVRAVEASSDVDVDIRAFISLSLAGGVRAEMTLLGDATEEIEEIRLFGENGTAGWLQREDSGAELYIRVAGGASRPQDAVPFRAPLPDAAFVEALRAGRSFASEPSVDDFYDAATAIPVITLTERLYRVATWR
ncbi:MAG: Gfo/Idh/MocA family oxidoreductase [Akkermansiaceae bacterium]|nr:Gfo/Idh/MocA family oxidoreductase [Armatimonadota bacterium]